MKKRVIALISAVVLCLSLFPVLGIAAEDDTVTYKLTPLGTSNSYSGDICYFGDVTVSGIDLDNNSHTYSFSNFTCKPFFTNVFFSADELSTQAITVYPHFVGYDMVGSNPTKFAFVYITYDPSSLVVYNEAAFNFVFPGINNYTYADIEQARNEGYIAGQESIDQDAIRQEGYNEGYTAGQDSIDQDAIRQDGYESGYDDGYDAGFVAGQESIDQDAIRQDGYDNGYDDGYDVGYVAGEQSTDAYQNGFGDGAASIDQESIRQEGYDDGYDVGFGDGAASIDQDAIRQEGYDNGYSSAMQLVGDLSGGLFKNMVLAMDVSLDVDGRTIVENFDNVPYDLITGGIYFRSTLNFLQTTFGDTWEDRVTQVVLRLQFEHGSISGQLPVDWSASPILISGSALVDSATLKTVDNVLYAMTAEDGSYGSLRNFVFNDPSDITYPVIYKEFSLKVGRPGDLLNEMTLWSNSEFYGTGYAAGYADGLSSDSADVYDKAYDEGHQVGYAAGKKEGLELSKTGDWKNLMLAVTEAPINTFQSLFNFEILGLDMRLAFGSILAVCVLLIIVKKVLL